jgi:hypothetical protein
VEIFKEFTDETLMSKDLQENEDEFKEYFEFSNLLIDNSFLSLTIAPCDPRDGLNGIIELLKNLKEKEAIKLQQVDWYESDMYIDSAALLPLTPIINHLVCFPDLQSIVINNLFCKNRDLTAMATNLPKLRYLLCEALIIVHLYAMTSF